MRKELKTGLTVLSAIIAVIVIGTAGYMLIEGWGFLPAFFMTITTIFTVGSPSFSS
jgi:voltage-gated potassium channel